MIASYVLGICYLFFADVTLADIPDRFADGRAVTTYYAEDGSVLLGGDGFVHHWSADGTHRRRIAVSGRVTYCALVQGYYLVTPETGPSLYFDAEGAPFPAVADTAFARIAFLQEVGEKRFAPRLDAAFLKRHPYAFLAREVLLLPGARGMSTRWGGEQFAKATPMMQDLYYQFPRIFVAEGDRARGGTSRYFVVNQLEAKVYRYDDDALMRERADGQDRPTEVPFTLPALAKRAREPVSLFSPGLVVYEGAEKRRVDDARRAWSYGLGLNVQFLRYDRGYLLVYEIPEYADDGTPTGYHLGLQRLDFSLEAAGMLLETDGLPLGIRVGQGVPTYLSLRTDVSSEAVGTRLVVLGTTL